MRAIILALAVLTATAAPTYAQAAATRRRPRRQHRTPASSTAAPDSILYTIKPGSTADFETVLNKTKEALAKSEKPERKQQAASWRVYKSDTPAANGNVTYVMIIDPAIKDADYNVDQHPERGVPS